MYELKTAKPYFAHEQFIATLDCLYKILQVGARTLLGAKSFLCVFYLVTEVSKDPQDASHLNPLHYPKWFLLSQQGRSSEVVLTAAALNRLTSAHILHSSLCCQCCDPPFTKSTTQVCGTMRISHAIETAVLTNV